MPAEHSVAEREEYSEAKLKVVVFFVSLPFPRRREKLWKNR